MKSLSTDQSRMVYATPLAKTINILVKQNILNMSDPTETYEEIDEIE